MNENQHKIIALLTTLVGKQSYEIKPATDVQIEIFRLNAVERQVDESVIAELVDLYRVADNFNYETILAFHACTDEILFEWWDDRELWLGQRDFYTLRWANGKFCLGDASNVSFSPEYEAATLIGLLEICTKDIRDANYFAD